MCGRCWCRPCFCRGCCCSRAAPLLQMECLTIFPLWIVGIQTFFGEFCKNLSPKLNRKAFPRTRERQNLNPRRLVEGHRAANLLELPNCCTLAALALRGTRILCGSRQLQLQLHDPAKHPLGLLSTPGRCRPQPHSIKCQLAKLTLAEQPSRRRVKD